MKIGNVEIKGRTALAPMAGVTDRAFRELCVAFGASYVVGEMVSAKGISFNSERSKELMILSENERPAAVQLFGSEPQTVAAAAVTAMEYKPDIIDINMGCPAPKISGNGAGSALMKNPDLCGKIVEAVCKAVDVPITVKIRKGWDDKSVNAVEVAKICEQAGASANPFCAFSNKRDNLDKTPLSLLECSASFAAFPINSSPIFFKCPFAP